MELLGHFEGYHAPRRVTSQKIRTLGLAGMYLFDVESCHVLNPGVRSLFAIQPLGLEPIQGLIRAQITRQIAIAENIAPDGMDEEQRGFGTVGLDRHQRRPRRGPSFLAEQVGELLNGRSLEEGSQGKCVAGHLGNFLEQTHSE